MLLAEWANMSLMWGGTSRSAAGDAIWPFTVSNSGLAFIMFWQSHVDSRCPNFFKILHPFVLVEQELFDGLVFCPYDARCW